MYPELITATPTQVEPIQANPHRLRHQSWTTSERHRGGALGKVVSTAHHFSQLLYAIPSARVRALLAPCLHTQRFELVETADTNQAHCWLSVTSFLDQPQTFAGMPVSAGFELSEYRVLVQREGHLYQWLIHTSVGSLMAAAARHLWALPWHLSASEFRQSYDDQRMRYQTYRLQMQSEHVNALWELHDSGEPVAETPDPQLPRFLFNPLFEDCFLRRAGGMGTRNTRFRFQLLTRGTLKSGRCDFLTRQGWLTPAELAHPQCVQLSRSAVFEQEAPLMLPANESALLFSLKRAA